MGSQIMFRNICEPIYFWANLFTVKRSGFLQTENRAQDYKDFRKLKHGA